MNKVKLAKTIKGKLEDVADILNDIITDIEEFGDDELQEISNEWITAAMELIDAIPNSQFEVTADDTFNYIQNLE